MSWLSNAIGTSRPSAPTLPAAPTLQTPQLPNYPGLTPEQQALLQQIQQYMTQSQGAISSYGNNPYLQQSQQASQQALTNYQNSLTGNIPQNQAIAQQKERDWAQTKANASQQGIRLTGDTPEKAVSSSTAGNQIIQDFNKRYGALEQNYQLGQQQIGLSAQQYGNQQANTQFQNTLGGYQTLGQLAQNPLNIYGQQQLGQFGVNTNQAMTNADIANQNAMNQYQRQIQQLGLNYNDQLAGYQNRMGLISGGLQLGGMALGGIATGGSPMGIMAGGQAGGALGQTFTGNAQGQGNNMANLGSYITAYQQQKANSMGLTGVPSNQIGYGIGNRAPAGYWANNTYGGR